MIARFICLQNERKLETSKFLIKEIVAEVEEVWGRASIPTKSTTIVIFLMTSLHGKWEILKKFGQKLIINGT